MATSDGIAGCSEYPVPPPRNMKSRESEIGEKIKELATAFCQQPLD